MRSLGTFVLAAVALCASSIANAADMLPTKAAPGAAPPSVAPLWSGFYVGVQAGGGFGHSKLDPLGGGATLAAFDQSGGIFGARFGYNWQIGEWGVVGIVTTGDYIGNVKDTVSGIASKYSWMGTIGGRAGFLLRKNLLAYGTGGLAFAKGELGIPVTKTLTWTTEDLRAGFFVGAGAEYRFDRHWSVFAEWTWADFGRNSQFVVLSERSDLHKIVGGVNAKF